MRVLWRVIVKEFLQIRRDRRMIPVIFVAPVVQIVDLRLRRQHRRDERAHGAGRPGPQRREPRPRRAGSSSRATSRSSASEEQAEAADRGWWSAAPSSAS